MNLLAVFLVSVGVAIAEYAPTQVHAPLFRTVPPSEGEGFKFVETLYKMTDSKTYIHTVEPLQPSYEVKYGTTSMTTMNNQTISTSSVEFATVLNSTVLYNTDMTSNNTYDVAPTFYQTKDYLTESIRYTTLTNNTKSVVSYTEINALPFV